MLFIFFFLIVPIFRPPLVSEVVAETRIPGPRRFHPITFLVTDTGVNMRVLRKSSADASLITSSCSGNIVIEIIVINPDRVVMHKLLLQRDFQPRNELYTIASSNILAQPEPDLPQRGFSRTRMRLHSVRQPVIIALRDEASETNKGRKGGPGKSGVIPGNQAATHTGDSVTAVSMAAGTHADIKMLVKQIAFQHSVQPEMTLIIIAGV